MTLGQQIAIGFETWELWFVVGVWTLIPIIIYWGNKQNKKIAILQQEADEALKKWIAKSDHNYKEEA